MSTQVIVITGANTGLGYLVVKDLLSSVSADQYHIFLGARSSQKANEAIDNLKKEISNPKGKVEPLIIDVTDDASIAKAVSEVESKADHVDVLVNNAGVQVDKFVNEGSMKAREGWAQTWDVNVTGAHLMTEALMPLLIKSKSQPRLLFLASGTSSLDEASRGTIANMSKNPAAGWPKEPHPSLPLYRSAKAGLNMLMLEWSRLVKNDGIKVFSVSPGFLATGLGGMPVEMQKKFGAIEPSEGARFVADVVRGKRDEDHSKVIRDSAQQPW